MIAEHLNGKVPSIHLPSPFRYNRFIGLALGASSSKR